MGKVGLLAFLAAGWAIVPLSARQSDGVSVRFAVPGAAVPGADGEPHATDALLEGQGMSRLPAGRPVDAPFLAGLDILLLDGRSLEAASGWTGAAIGLIESAVERGLGLVVSGPVAALHPRSEAFSRLLGRKAALRDEPAGPFALDLPDQSHPITQCITALYFTGASATAEAAGGVTVLGRALEPPREDGMPPGARPALWVRRVGRGAVAVLAIQLPAAGLREEGALAFLTARAAEWAAAGRAGVPIPADLPLAAELLGRGDFGVLPGLRQVEGYYRGRQIAPVMGWQGIDWLSRPDREETELPERVLDELGIEEGSTVADLGAGAGYFSFRLARRVGPGGKVLAIDIQEEMLKALRARMDREDIRNVQPLLATETDPRLPGGEVDLVLLVDVYHELSRPAEVMSAVERSLRPAGQGRRGGRMVLVEYRGEDPLVPIKPLHRTTVRQMKAEIEPMGFRFLESKEFLPHQHVLFFERR